MVVGEEASFAPPPDVASESSPPAVLDRSTQGEPGRELSSEEPVSERPPDTRTPPKGEPPAGHDTPLAERGEEGPLVPYLRTVALALFHPARLFEGMRVDHARSAFAFGWATTALAVLFGFLWQGTGLEPTPVPLAPEARRANALLGIVLGPLVGLGLGLFATWLGAISLSLAVLGAAPRGRAATVRAVGYGSAPLVLMAIPGIGGAVGTIWSLVLTSRALRWLHGIAPIRAIAAVLLPWAIAAIALQALASALLGSGMLPRG